MKTGLSGRNRNRIAPKAAYLLIFLFLASCAGLNPKRVDVTLPTEPPAPKTTSFDRALSDLGQMTLIYGCDLMKIMLYGGQDHTGASAHTGAEIPRDIMEMVKSTINAVGGNVYYVPYNPDLINTLVQLGWTSYAGKQIPHVILTGGITEFDRGLSTRGKNNDFGVETKPFTHAPKWTPGDMIGIDYGDGSKESLARITLDFNLLDLQNNIGIQKMQSVNSIFVHKAVAEKELAITLFGPTIGLKGSIKKVEGRHAAVRLLVQLGVVQIVGKFFDLPYWNLLPGAKPDAVVESTVMRDFSAMGDSVKAIKTQELLILLGCDIPVTGEWDEPTLAALNAVDPPKASGNAAPAGAKMDAERYWRLYCAVPVDGRALKRRYRFNALLEEYIASLRPPVAPTPPAAEPADGSEKNDADAPRSSASEPPPSRTTDPAESGNEDSLAMEIIDLLGNNPGKTTGADEVVRSEPPGAGREW